jgi:pimeloyl-ACP methyl ester carboxylesterase
MYYSVQCGEEMPFVLRDAVVGAAQDHPRLAAYSEYSARSLFASCDTWQAPRADGAANSAVVSAIPTLVLTGEFDPITPPAWGHMVAGNLENSFIFDIPAIGHGAVFSDDCPASIAEAFVQDPQQEPPNWCIAAMGGLEWVVY